MSQTNPVSTSSWGQTTKVVLAGLVFLPILALTFVEWFVDPFPNSLWILRILNTNYLVHVRADLTVDGEPLVMERTFKCYDPVDYNFWRFFSGAKKYNDIGNVGDNIHAVTAKGRLFSIMFPEICDTIISRSVPGQLRYPVPYQDKIEPYLLSLNDIDTPIVFEIHGARSAEQVDAYVVPALLRQGYHGVKLDEVVLSLAPQPVSPWDFIKDWDGFEWFGQPGWMRPNLKDGRFYVAGYVVPIPEGYWSNPISFDSLTPEIIKNGAAKAENYEAFANRIAFLTKDTSFPVADWSFWGIVRFIRDATFTYGPRNWRKERQDILENSAYFRSQWAFQRFVGCAYARAGTFNCNPDMVGVLSFRILHERASFIRKDGQGISYYKFPDFQLETDRNPTDAALYRYKDRTIYVGHVAEAMMGEN